jgi:hypothetical protein
MASQLDSQRQHQRRNPVTDLFVNLLSNQHLSLRRSHRLNLHACRPLNLRFSLPCIYSIRLANLLVAHLQFRVNNLASNLLDNKHPCLLRTCFP